MTDDRNSTIHTSCRIFLDFDGTITEDDTLVQPLDRFASPRWWDVENQVLAGELKERESLQAEMDFLRVSWEEALSFLLPRVRLRKGFREFATWSQEQGLQPVVLSGGFRSIINAVFRHHGIELPVYANDVKIQNKRWRVIPAATPRLRGHCNHCKTWHLEKSRRRNRRLLFVGDGTTDRCAASGADFVFARGFLADYCRRERIPFAEFNDFHDIVAGLRREKCAPREEK